MPGVAIFIVSIAVAYSGIELSHDFIPLIWVYAIYSLDEANYYRQE